MTCKKVLYLPYYKGWFESPSPMQWDVLQTGAMRSKSTRGMWVIWPEPDQITRPSSIVMMAASLPLSTVPHQQHNFRVNLKRVDRADWPHTVQCTHPFFSMGTSWMHKHRKCWKKGINWIWWFWLFARLSFACTGSLFLPSFMHSS